MNRMDEIIGKVREVPSLPAVVIKLRRYLNDPEVDFGALARVIEFDPGLTANILQLANSTYFGWSRSISSSQEAILRLGTARIFQMVLCMSVAPIVRKPVRGYGLDSDGFWRHSISVAIGAEQLASVLDGGRAGDAFTAGLLHDLGKVILGTFVEVDDEPLKRLVVEEGLAFDEAEKAVLGLDHAEAAAILLEHWSLPEDVVAAVRYHHLPDPVEGDPRLADLVHVADALSLKAGHGLGSDGRNYRLSEESIARLGITAETAEAVMAAVEDGLDELQSLYLPGTTAGRQGTETCPSS